MEGRIELVSSIAVLVEVSFLSTDKDLYLYKKNCISKYGILVKSPIEYKAYTQRVE